MTAYPTTVTRNPYYLNPKNSVVRTPLWLAQCIKDNIEHVLTPATTIYDIGCDIGNLSMVYTQKRIGFDIRDIDTYPGYFHNVNFLNYNPGTTPSNKGDTLILSNPPFNDTDRVYGKRLLPELFLKHIFKVFGNKAKVIMFAPMGLLKNQSLQSPRWKWVRDCEAKITSELEVPIDAYIPEGNRAKFNKQSRVVEKDYKGKEMTEELAAEKKRRIAELKIEYGIVLVHSSILFFNIQGLPAKLFIEEEYI